MKYVNSFSVASFFVLALQSTFAFGFSFTGIDLRFTGDSNPAKAEFDRDIEATNSFSAQLTANLLSGTLKESPTLSSGWSINSVARYALDADIPELGESFYGLNVGISRESKTGPGAPFLNFSTGVGYIDSETDIRDSVLVNLSGSVNFQPTGFFDTTLGIQHQLREAETEVFDTNKTTFFATANFAPAAKLVLRTGLRYVIGNEISSATPTLDIVNTAAVIELDDAFSSSSQNRFAYLIDANSTIAELGAGFEFTSNLKANLLYRFVSTSADGGISYDRNLLEFTISIEL